MSRYTLTAMHEGQRFPVGLVELADHQEKYIESLLLEGVPFELSAVCNARRTEIIELSLSLMPAEEKRT